MSTYNFAKFFVKIYFKIFYNWIIKGKDNIPNDSSVVLVSNHISNLDPLVVACSVDRQVYFMAKEELFSVPILGKLITSFGAFSVKRGENDRKAIKTGLNLLKDKKVLGIFPEGTRSKTEEIAKGLPGAALLALKTDASVIPIGIVSDYKLFKSINIYIGEPISLNEYKKEKITSDDLDNAIDLIMSSIKKQVDEIKNNN